MLDAQKQAYGDGLDQTKLHPYMWTCKGHYYSSGLSYYNFPYAFGGLFAMGLYTQFLNEGESFVPKYNALLKATATCSVEDTAKMAGIDLTKPDFWRSSLQTFANLIVKCSRWCTGLPTCRRSRASPNRMRPRYCLWLSARMKACPAAMIPIPDLPLPT